MMLRWRVHWEFQQFACLGHSRAYVRSDFPSRTACQLAPLRPCTHPLATIRATNSHYGGKGGKPQGGSVGPLGEANVENIGVSICFLDVV